jgi:peptidoglycan/LPS O-acetylase OafA/YrhL
MPRHFHYIDALRGWAITGVFLVHVTQRIHGLPFYLDALFQQGARGVQLFFIVSAFTLFHSLEERRQVEKKPVLYFFIRRFFRIVPMFWAAIIFYLVTDFPPHYLSAGSIQWTNIISAFLLVQGWLPEAVNRFVPGDWSITTEASFYCVLPLLVYKIHSLSKSLWLTLLAVPPTHLFSLIVRKAVVAAYSQKLGYMAYDYTFFWFPAQFPVFCLGIVLYFVLKPKLKSGLPMEPKDHGFSRWLLALSLYLIIGCAVGAYWYVPHHFIYSIAFFLLAWSLALNPVWFFVNSFTRYLGKISYSCYLLHAFVLRSCYRVIQNHGWVDANNTGSISLFACLLLAVVVLTMLISSVTYYAIELPSINLGKRLIRHLRAADAASSP